ncbi:heme oxygenase (biliverdin-producing) [uncultured Nocardioides sp.]|uniref:biliverdin-producing heme oxygenase n=1 Tax=uncultured Nocardioides sp. TaxID=198441 RepID=UPI002632459F|nr:biliverdin-producing heme oxygenase [uncultured Nocardioides sp.]
MTLTEPTTEVEMPLSRAMREGSAAEHEAAEGSAFLTELLGGRLTRPAYVAYLVHLRVVYAALEASLDEHAAHPAVAAVHDPALARVARIDADLAWWTADTSLPEAGPAARAYAARIAAARDEPTLLVAHHYTRYLGDLSGGQVVGHGLARVYDLPRRGEGLSFYSFAEVGKPKPYKDAYRARLDALPLGPVDQEAVVEEVRAAFRHNRAVFAELAQLMPAWRV